MRALTASWIACLFVAATAAVPVRAQSSSAVLTGDDYMEIERLYSRYHWLVDAVDGEGWAQLFTADGTWESGAGAMKARGHDELAKVVARAMNGGPSAKHPLGLVTNIWVEPAGDGTVRGGAYSARIAPPGPGGAPTISSMSVFEDVMVKTPDGWRFKSRRIHGGQDIALAPSRRAGTLPSK